MGENSLRSSLVLNNKNTIISDDLSSDSVFLIDDFFKSMGVLNYNFPAKHDFKDSFSEITRGSLKVQHIHRGKISCILSVKPPIMNIYGTLHGGAVGAVAERVAIACARTIMGKNNDIFLGELSISYLSGAPRNAEIVVNASVIRSGRNLTVVAVEFRLKDSEKLIYICHATFYHVPVASL